MRYVLGLVILLSFTGCSDEAPERDPNTVDFAVSILGSTEPTCQIYGVNGMPIGQGAPELISYGVTTEQYGIARCGTRAGVFAVGAKSVTVNTTTSLALQNFGSGKLPAGAMHIMSLVSNLVDSTPATPSFAHSPSFILKSLIPQNLAPILKGIVKAKLLSATALADFLAALQAFQDLDVCDNQARASIAKQLLNMGQPMVLSAATAKIVGGCSEADLLALSSDALGFDLATIGAGAGFPSDGCLILHPLAATTSLNGLVDPPSQNDLAFIRSLATESGVVEALCEASAADRSYSIADVLNALTGSGYLNLKAYSEDVEGNITDDVTVTSEDLLRVLKVIGRRAEVDSFGDVSGNYKLSTGYNPGGGWYADVLATNAVGFNANCYPTLPGAGSTKGALTGCPNPPRYGTYDVDTAKWTFDAAGTHVLILDLRKGVYTTAHPFDTESGAYLRDAKYRRVDLTPLQVHGVAAASFNAVGGFYSVYTPNPTYNSALDPLGTDDASKNPKSAPFASSAWRATFPYMTKRARTFLFQYPEVVGPQALFLTNVSTLTQRMDAMAAFGAIKLLTSIGGIPHTIETETEEGSTFTAGHAIFKDHELTPQQWDERIAAFLKSGTPRTRIRGENIVVTFKDGDMKGKGKKACKKNRKGGQVDCDLDIDIQVGNPVKTGPGTREYDVTGSFTFDSPEHGTFVFTPGVLLVSTAKSGVTQARFQEGDSGSCLHDKKSQPGCMTVDVVGIDLVAGLEDKQKKTGKASFTLYY